ncbi:MAG: thymidine phosphorylase family protein, partial [archaeon]|nr:thymidine phosphorylase family protein [archaeon]
EVSYNGGKLVAIVDIVHGFLKKGEISLSEEIMEYLKIKPKSFVEVNPSLEPKSSFYIAKKLAGRALARAEIYHIVRDMANNALTEAEIAYFVSGVYEHGMSKEETINLTEAMYKTGQVINWGAKKIADKHSIGGIAGNRTTPLVVSICAAAGITMPKTSSRAITSAAGTADVMETIANVEFPVDKLKKIVQKAGACFAWGGSLGLAPVDDKLIRVERLLNLDPESQLIASILAKKLAVGSKYVLIDIPYGKNAKVNLQKAKRLSAKFIEIGRHFKLNLRTVLTEGSEPIGNGIGPVLEMIDVLRVLKRTNPPRDLENKGVMLAGIILEMLSKAKKGKGEKLAQDILDSGKAYKKFCEIIEVQGRKNTVLKPAKFAQWIKSNSSGKITAIDNRCINLLGRILGCPVDKTSGIYLYKHVGDEVRKGEPVMTLYAESPKKLKEALSFLRESKPISIK